MIDVFEKFPKAAEVVRKYYLEKLVSSLDAKLPEEFKEHVREKGLDAVTVAKIVEEAPRMLTDTFDENDIIIEIRLAVDDLTFYFTIYHNKVQDFFGNRLKSRKEAEKAAIVKAFELLEEKLCEKKD